MKQAGGVAEWFKATVLKTVLGNTNVGSNPTATFSYSSLLSKKIKRVCMLVNPTNLTDNL
jgi:hypothetical protein